MWVHRRRGGPLGLLLLGGQIMNVGVYNIPPVTLTLIAAQVVIYIKLIEHVLQYFPSANAVCISTYLLYYHSQWKRLFLSPFYHADDMHLYFNMVSLLWKGMMLEKMFRSTYFAFLVAVFTVATGMVYVILSMLMDGLMDDHRYSTSCAIGFSGVLFAMKVLTTHYTPSGLHYAFGFIPVPSRWIYWVELILISMVYPNASFIGHLSGILVGLLYVHGPLKLMMDSILLPGPSRTQTTTYYYRQQYTPRTINVSFNNAQHSSDGQGMSEDEQIARATENSLRDTGQTSQSQTSQSRTSQSGLYPDLEELRQRRLNRYN
ncbi:rhomboid-related protein 4-like [Gigantopelta aegis]|uniref:rhomboid-related protein 4-like n=1 Tax=Gigantopelta aegis TaxID=1735272 RepID=UPI001B888D8D|nr:rhomboid-related protein 4-like [Gigantopelta aegis]XP_041353096.1 rhomboid-related protein 4-like [Gigantopelta aegis]XP_041353104.1 rhomboid-related protein 4-like [Gigantopelta aegis]